MLVSWTCFRIIQPSSCLPFCESDKEEPRVSSCAERNSDFSRQRTSDCGRHRNQDEARCACGWAAADLQVEAGALRHAAEGGDGGHAGEGAHQDEDPPAVELVRRAHLEAPACVMEHSHSERVHISIKSTGEDAGCPCSSCASLQRVGGPAALRGL